MKPSNSELPGAGFHILLVDDVPHGTVARRNVLEQRGYKVCSVTSAEEALEVCESLTFDVVVTDFRMTGMDGIGLISRLKQLKPCPKTILLSGFVDLLGLTEESSGADAVIGKSSSEVESLVRNVARLLHPEPTRRPAARALVGQMRVRSARSA